MSGCLRCLLLVMCTHPFAKKALTLHLARSEGQERYFSCNLMHRKVLASSHQHLMAEAPADEFLLPSNPTHRQYEALRTFFVDRAPSAEAAERFGYTPGSFRVLCHEFRKNPQREFFLPQTKKAKLPPPRERLRQKIITLRKQNSSVYDIRDALDQSGEKLSPASISTILKEEGFARLPRRRDDERPATTRPNAADVADAGKLDLSERTFRTKVGGLFLFLPYLAKIPLDKMLADAKFPGTKMMPAAHAIRSLLAMKLFGSARHSHVIPMASDRGAIRTMRWMPSTSESCARG